MGELGRMGADANDDDAAGRAAVDRFRPLPDDKEEEPDGVVEEADDERGPDDDDADEAAE